MDVAACVFACGSERRRLSTWLDCREIFSETFISVGLPLVSKSITFVTRLSSRNYAIPRRRRSYDPCVAKRFEIAATREGGVRGLDA